jgi:hypothetical protein
MLDILDPAYTPELILLGVMLVLIAILIGALIITAHIPPRVQRRYPHAYRIAKVQQQGRSGFKSRTDA